MTKVMLNFHEKKKKSITKKSNKLNTDIITFHDLYFLFYIVRL